MADDLRVRRSFFDSEQGKFSRAHGIQFLAGKFSSAAPPLAGAVHGSEHGFFERCVLGRVNNHPIAATEAIFPPDHVAPRLCTPSTLRSLRLVMGKNDLRRSDRMIVNTPYVRHGAFDSGFRLEMRAKPGQCR